MRRKLLLSILSGLLLSGFFKITLAGEYFQQAVEYDIRVKLNTADRKISGNETIRYTNNSPDTLSEFYLHLYPNAYRSKESELISHYLRRFNHTFFDIPKDNRGYLNINNVTVDDVGVNARVDDTIARMTLPAPLLPGATIVVRLDFEGKVRKHLGRAGYRNKHYDFAQWYPKVVVYDENGFHPDKFKAGEFYGEYGSFDVHIELPANYVVAATGTLVAGDPGWDLNPKNAKNRRRDSIEEPAGPKTVHFHADNVHDFAWCTDPDFVVQDSTVGDVKVYSFYKKQNAHAWQDTSLAHGVRAVAWLSEKVGPYPYPQASVVDALIDGGMEYPMLVMDGSARESLALHEIGHIYFYGILGNDERAEAWLDEGLTTFQTAWYLHRRYGPWGDRGKWDLYKKITPQHTLAESAREQVRDFQLNGYGERVAKRAEEFDHSYYLHVYQKAALMFLALRYVVGEETFEAILHEYYRRWQFKHVNEARFVEVCEEISGMDLGLFFEQWLHTKKICDYKLDEVKALPVSGGYDTSVKIKRTGEMVMPLELVFDLENGEKRSFRLDGRLRTINENFLLPARPKSTAVNPDNEIADIKLSDNFSPRKRALQFDWPGNYYYPEDAYQFRYRPGFWYNDVDGLKAGLLLRGSYLDRLRKFRLGVYYGFESDRVDFSVAYDRPMRLFGNNTRFHASGYKMEGRRDVTWYFKMRRRKTFEVPPNQDFVVGFNYHELTNPSYLDNPETYDTSLADLGPFIAYSVNPQFDIFSSSVDLGLKLGREWGSGNFKYERLTSDVRLYSRPAVVPVDTRVRVFFGLMGGNAPLQQKFNLSGGGPLMTERRFYLRSPGAIWKDLNYHEGGHGNLRGYQAGSFGVNRLLAFNIETGTQLPLLWLENLTRRITGGISWAAFVDVGKIFDTGNPIGSSARVQKLVDAGILDRTLVDAGIGLRSYKSFPFYNLALRLDLPLYVNHPEVNGEKDEVKRRYLLSLSASF